MRQKVKDAVLALFDSGGEEEDVEGLQLVDIAQALTGIVGGTSKKDIQAALQSLKRAGIMQCRKTRVCGACNQMSKEETWYLWYKV